MRKELYSVWVGGVEVNDYLLDCKDAFELMQKYYVDGYDDVYMALAEVKEVE
jgi:hypothetical protein